MKVTIDFSVWKTQKDFCQEFGIKKNRLSNMIADKHPSIVTRVIPQLNNIVLIRKAKK